MRSVEGRDLRRTTEPVEKVACRVWSERQRRHAAFSLCALLVPAARYNNPPRFSEG